MKKRMVELVFIVSGLIVVGCAMYVMNSPTVGQPDVPAPVQYEVKTDSRGDEWLIYGQGGAQHRIRIKGISAVFGDPKFRTTIYFTGGKLATDIPLSAFDSEWFPDTPIPEDE